MVLRRWEPFREVVSLREAMDRLFEDGFIRHPRRGSHLRGEDTLSLDAYHTPESLVIKVAIPGVKPEDLDITVTGNTLTIKGEAKSEEEVKEESYFLREGRYGTFSRSVTLPRGLKTDEIEASYEDGVLTLTIPKEEEAKPKAIKVNVKKSVEGRKA